MDWLAALWWGLLQCLPEGQLLLVEELPLNFLITQTIDQLVTKHVLELSKVAVVCRLPEGGNNSVTDSLAARDLV